MGERDQHRLTITYNSLGALFVAANKSDPMVVHLRVL